MDFESSKVFFYIVGSSRKLLGDSYDNACKNMRDC